ncbi:unnamed protein product [Moneuplotes crassus]|uniref:Uncharacterized protein n=1 Tax=Euplotes crassus TaxID=5936 RepID=A0AAD1XJI9_EUPCR|nr:unnamed protein product [Moneuplotes crassus]
MEPHRLTTSGHFPSLRVRLQPRFDRESHYFKNWEKVKEVRNNLFCNFHLLLGKRKFLTRFLIEKNKGIVCRSSQRINSEIMELDKGVKGLVKRSNACFKLGSNETILEFESSSQFH